MLSYQATTTLSTNGAGVVVLTPGFQGKAVLIKGGAVVGGSGAAVTMEGWSDGTLKSCDWSFNDGTLRASDKHTDRIVSIRDNIGGVLTEVTSATNPVFTATQVKLDVTTTANSANYKVSFLVLG